jgi:hypothetical protein
MLPALCKGLWADVNMQVKVCPFKYTIPKLWKTGFNMQHLLRKPGVVVEFEIEWKHGF